MKNQILLPILAVLGLQTTQAQPLLNIGDDHALASSYTAPAPTHVRVHHAPAPEAVGYLAQTAFYQDFREATDAHWTPGRTMDRVDFVLNGRNLSAYYDQQANLIGTTSQRAWEDLPDRARKEITKRYPGYTPRDVIFFEDNTYNETDMILYDNRFDDADNYFVQLSDGARELVLQVSPEGNISVFREKK